MKWPLALGLVLSTLALPSTASAAAEVARIVGPDGGTIATAPAQAGYAFPADGSVAQVADVVAGSGALRIRGISLLGGRIRIDRAVVGSRASVDGVVVDGVVRDDQRSRYVASKNSRHQSPTHESVAAGRFGGYAERRDEAARAGVGHGRAGAARDRVRIC